MSALRARVGQPEEALRLLEIYAKAFILRNGFHANGDQTKSGYSNYTYRPFTLEGNFLAMHAVHEMLLQSWSATPGHARHRGHPPLPGDLRAMEGRVVRRPAGRRRLRRVRPARERRDHVVPRQGQPRRHRCACATTSAAACRPGTAGGVRKAGADYEVSLKAGDQIEARIDPTAR